MKLTLSTFLFLIAFQVFGQNETYFRTTEKKNFHYLEFSNDNVIVYKMGSYIDKAGSGSAIILTDTLVLTNENEFTGKHYTLFKNKTVFTLHTDKGKKLDTEPQNDLTKVNTDLNNAYCLKSYFDLSDKLNKKFPLYHYTFRNGYYVWEKLSHKNISHKKFIEQTDKEIAFLYDSISQMQIKFTKTTDFICENAKQIDYRILKDSLSTLPIDYRPQSGYFDKSVYQMVKANPEYFYKILQDFPNSKTFIYFAVDQDKEIIKQLKVIEGYDDLKKEFLKDHKFGKSMPYKIIGLYAVIAGLLTWLIVSQ